MCEIYDKCVGYGMVDGNMDYVCGVNIFGFLKVVEVMLVYGIV